MNIQETSSHILDLISVHSFPLSKAVSEPLLSAGEFGLVIFGLIVAIGLIGEHVSEKRRVRWVPETIRVPSWNWPLIWLWVVVAGVFFEFICDAAVWEASDSLQLITENEINAANNNAGKAELEAAQLRLRAAKIEREVSWRRYLTDSQSKNLYDFFNTHRMHLALSSLADDPEARRFCLEIADAVAAGEAHREGDTNNRVCSLYLYKETMVGLQLLGDSSPGKSELAEDFRSIDLPVIEVPKKGNSGANLELLVGKKPPPSFPK